MQLNSKDLMRSLYRTRYARLDVSQLSNVLTAYVVAGHSTVVNGPYTPVRTGGGRGGQQTDPQYNAQKLQWPTGDLAEVASQTP